MMILRVIQHKLNSHGGKDSIFLNISYRLRQLIAN